MVTSASQLLRKAILIVSMIVCVCGNVNADTSHMISFQGVVYNTNGTVVAQGTYPMKFSLYDSPQGGTLLWSETKNINIVRGAFSTNLGDTTTLELLYESPVYITYNIDGGADFSPRIQLTSVPKSVRAYVADSLARNFVSSIQDLSGDITLIPGTGISISTSATSLTISASGSRESSWQQHSNTLATSQSVFVGANQAVATNVSLEVKGDVLITASGQTADVPTLGKNLLYRSQSGTLLIGEQTSPKWADSTLENSTLLPGRQNRIGSDFSAVLGGKGNEVRNDAEYSTVVTGLDNIVDDNSESSAIVSGSYNDVQGFHSIIGAGQDNTVSSSRSGILAGSDNEVDNTNAAVVAGSNNTADGQFSFVGAGRGNRSAYISTGVVAGDSNWVVEKASGILAGRRNFIYSNSFYSGIVGGNRNDIRDMEAFIGAGKDNDIVFGGKRSAIVAGIGNTMQDESSAIAAGEYNNMDGGGSFIGAGESNHVEADLSAIVTGYLNKSQAVYGGILGGSRHLLSQNAVSSAIGAGGSDTILNAYGFIGAGVYNAVKASYSFIGSGSTNQILEPYSGIVSGRQNTIDADYSFIGGGRGNSTGGLYASVVSGYNSSASSIASFAQGYNTTAGGALSDTSAIAMGLRTSAKGLSSVAIGYECSTVERHSTALGYLAKTTADQSFAFGVRARSNHDGAVVIGATNNTSLADSISSGGVSQIVLMAERGLYITNQFGAGVYNAARLINTSSGAYLTNGGTWTNSSDRSLKTNVTPVDGADVLARIKNLNISRWQYIADEDGALHIGPMAQDFYAAFGLGSDDKSISTIDPAGVALVGIQELAKENAELKEEVAELKALVQQLLEKSE